MSALIRVFPRKTNASPDDPLAFFADPPEGVESKASRVHVSVTFTYDIPKAERLAEAWAKVIPNVKIGGPAYDDKGGEFVPGRYLKKGYVITSRGCHNRCWFCSVWRREGPVRELKINQGWNLLDSNILACSDGHIKKVFDMLAKWPGTVRLTGGLEAAQLTSSHVERLWELRPSTMFFAYDTPDDLDPLREAGAMLRYADFTRWHLRCYVLIGYKGDTLEAAQERLTTAWEAGFMPAAMLYRDNAGIVNKDWRKFQKIWTRPPLIKARMKEIYSEFLRAGSSIKEAV